MRLRQSRDLGYTFIVNNLKNNSQNPEELGGLLHEYGQYVSSDAFKCVSFYKANLLMAYDPSGTLRSD